MSCIATSPAFTPIFTVKYSYIPTKKSLLYTSKQVTLSFLLKILFLCQTCVFVEKPKQRKNKKQTQTNLAPMLLLAPNSPSKMPHEIDSNSFAGWGWIEKLFKNFLITLVVNVKCSNFQLNVQVHTFSVACFLAGIARILLRIKYRGECQKSSPMIYISFNAEFNSLSNDT